MVGYKTISDPQPFAAESLNRTNTLPRTSAARARAVSEPNEGRNGETIDFGPLEDWIGYQLRLAQTASFAAFAHEAKDVDLSPGRFAALLLIGRNPGISQAALSRAVGIDKSTVTFALDNLMKRGFVKRTRVSHDRRAYSLSLTNAGERMLAKLTECATRHDRNLDRIVGPRDRAAFLRILRKIVAELS
jgi:DNA-binding MarR family transcriptional regulator